MGTDVQFYVERRNNGGDWETCDLLGPITEGELHDLYEHVGPGSGYYDDRNYSLFAILADVRNGYGFAGLDTGDGFNVIAAPRGLPDDMSCALASLTEWVAGISEMHTPSWLTLAEIDAFDWNQTAVKRGFVNGLEYEEWARTRHEDNPHPPGYCALPGPEMTQVSEEDMQMMVAAIKNDDPPAVWRPKIKTQLDETYSHITWRESYRCAAGSFMTVTLPKMRQLGPPDDVRCVFWFDS